MKSQKSDRTFHRPISIRVEGIRDVPTERALPRETHLTINHIFTRDKAREMVDFLEKQLALEHLTFITVEITGPSP